MRQTNLPEANYISYCSIKLSIRLCFFFLCTKISLGAFFAENIDLIKSSTSIMCHKKNATDASLFTPSAFRKYMLWGFKQSSNLKCAKNKTNVFLAEKGLNHLNNFNIFHSLCEISALFSGSIASKISIEHVATFLATYISKGALNIKLSPHVCNNPYIQRNHNKYIKKLSYV